MRTNFNMMVNGMTMNTIEEVAAYVAEYYADKKNRCNAVKVKVDDDELVIRPITKDEKMLQLCRGWDVIRGYVLGKTFRGVANAVEHLLFNYLHKKEMEEMNAPMLDKTIEVLKNAIDNPVKYYHDAEGGKITLCVGYDEFGYVINTEELVVDEDFWNEVFESFEEFESILVYEVKDIIADYDGVYIDVIMKEFPRLVDEIYLKDRVKEICTYALLKGKNTDWDIVIRKFELLEDIYDPYMGFNHSNVNKVFCSKLKQLIDSVSRGQMFGEDDGTIKFKLLLMADIYRNIEKWDIVNN